MPKNDFISDNLVHMRDRLKENAAKAAVSGAVPPRPSANRSRRSRGSPPGSPDAFRLRRR